MSIEQEIRSSLESSIELHRFKCWHEFDNPDISYHILDSIYDTCSQQTMNMAIINIWDIVLGFSMEVNIYMCVRSRSIYTPEPLLTNIKKGVLKALC